MQSAEETLSRLASSFASTTSLEGLVRPMLNLIQQATGLDSVYLTRISIDEGVQDVIYACSSDALALQEGASVPWQDTLCRRALNENRFVTQDVPLIWSDSQAARALGIQTYIGAPVRNQSADLQGTLCGASTERLEIPETTLTTLQQCADLIAHQISREEQARRGNAHG